MKNFSRFFTLSVLMAVFAFTFSNCEKEKDDPQETITTVELHMTQAGGFSEEFEWENLAGGSAPEKVDTVKLAPLNAYTVHLHLYDRSGGKNEDIGEEVENEAAEHLVIYSTTGNVGNIVITDTDANGKPLGIDFTWTTDQPTTGTIRVVLKHEPDKSSTDPSATGETDVDVTFPVRIQ